MAGHEHLDPQPATNNGDLNAAHAPSPDLHRWQIDSIDLDDPSAPRYARAAEMRRVIRRTMFISPFAGHPEYLTFNTEGPGGLDEAHYQCVTQDCDVIVEQLRDAPQTKLSKEQRQLVTAVLRVPRHAAIKRIIAAHDARTRYMQVINLAIGCNTSLRQLPSVLAAAASPEGVPLTDADVTDALRTFQAIFDEAYDEDGDYDDYDWPDPNETAEQAAVRAAERHLGYTPSTERCPAYMFDIAELEDLSLGELQERNDAELHRVLDLADTLPIIDAIDDDHLTANLDGQEIEIGIIDIMEQYLGEVLDELAGGQLHPRDMRFVRKMLRLPRNTPTQVIFERNEQRLAYIDYLQIRLMASDLRIRALEADPTLEAESPQPKPTRVTRKDVKPAVAAAEDIIATEREATAIRLGELAAQERADALTEAGDIFAGRARVTRQDMARAVMAAARQVLRESLLEDDDDDDSDDDGDIFAL